jgi:hypothetical protein
MILKIPSLYLEAVIIHYNYSIDESCHVPSSISPLMIPAPQVPNLWGTSGCNLFTMSIQCKTWDYSLH